MRRAAPDHLAEGSERVALALDVVRQPVEEALRRPRRAQTPQQAPLGRRETVAGRLHVTRNHVASPRIMWNPNACSCRDARPGAIWAGVLVRGWKWVRGWQGLYAFWRRRLRCAAASSRPVPANAPAIPTRSATTPPLCSIPAYMFESA